MTNLTYLEGGAENGGPENAVLLTAHNRHMEHCCLPAKPNDFISLTRFTRFIKSADFVFIARILILGVLSS